ncbi:hypothetical protein AWZ03_006632 [Drosophila navojoa]|uniref:Uncharacterized protein n=1 Tax=Drosophila navojoa TaxID=7232 RepID=A0A484BDX6_DRONA|nr:uncharacterized protein LOC108659679 [Drosophila navojoa]TDG46928.1 hypothetical protein AWZ03_006632 [Drosophila navojoa]
MVGPFMQGILLIGIIYWYSKSMMSMINDYYRSEFQRKLQAAGEAKAAEETPLNVDNFMDYVRDLETKEQPTKQATPSVTENSIKPNTEQTQKLLYFLNITGVYGLPDLCSAADSPIS